MEVRNHITQISVPGIKEAIFPATPLSKSNGAVNVFCGPNNSGKSHILRALAAIITEKKSAAAYQGFGITKYNSDNELRIYLSGPHWNRKETIGVISNRYKRIDPNKPADFRNFSLRLFCEQLKGEAFDINNASGSNEIFELLDQIRDDEFQLLPCNQEHEIISFIEAVLGGRLLYRKTKGNIEFVLANPSGLIVPYPKWSDGQKTVFYFILCVRYWRPDVLFADEIENHLHPLFMSKVLEFIKQKVPQSFVATHHPHIIFSDHIDQAFYFETDNGNTLPIVEKYLKVQKQKTPKRRVSLLSTSFSKLAATYKLFDVHDRQLLKQASQLGHETDFSLYKGVVSLFYPDVLPSSLKNLPDRQTLDLSSLIGFRDKATKILDYGAGIGRVAKEFQKISARGDTNPIWFCWEPSPDLREKLRERLIDSWLNYTVLDELDQLADSQCDIAIIANVVHELTPSEFADLLISVNQYTHETGEILIAEIYPLLQAEKYAVPYPYSVLNDLMMDVGFTCTHRSFPVKDAQAYCIMAKKHHALPDKLKIIETIESYWKKLKNSSLSSYHTRMSVSDSLDYKGLLMELNTIASIDAWESGYWKKHVYAKQFR